MNWLKNQIPRLSFEEKNAYAFSIGSFLRNSIFLLATFIFAKRWSSQDLGDLEQFFFIYSLLPLFLYFPITNSALVYYQKLDENQKPSFKNGLFFLVLIVSFTFAGIWFLFPKIQYLFWPETQSLNYYNLYVIILALQPFQFLLGLFLFLDKKINFQVVFSIVSVFLTATFFILPTFYSLDKSWHLKGWILILIFQMLWAIVDNFPIFNFGLNLSIFRKFIKILIPYALYAILAAIPLAGDNVLVNYLFQDKQIFAEFRLGIKELPFILLISNTIHNIFVQKISHEGLSALPQLKSTSSKWYGMTIGISTILFVFSHFLFVYYLQEKYKQSELLFHMMLMLWISRFLFSQSVLAGMGHQRYFILVGLIELILNLVLSIGLGLTMGLPGVVLGTLIAFLAEKLIYVWILYKKYHIKIYEYMHIKHYAIGIIWLGIVFLYFRII